MGATIRLAKALIGTAAVKNLMAMPRADRIAHIKAIKQYAFAKEVAMAQTAAPKRVLIINSIKDPDDIVLAVRTKLAATWPDAEILSSGPEYTAWKAQMGGGWDRIEMGGNSVCVVAGSGEGQCWIRLQEGGELLSAPAGVAFEQMEPGGSYACGLTTEHDIICWGEGDGAESAPPRPE